MNYKTIEKDGCVPIKAWTNDVPVEDNAITQLQNTASLPFVYKNISVMPDVHVGRGCSIGSVIPTIGAVIPAAVGVDLGCGCVAVKTNMNASHLPDNLKGIRHTIEREVPVGRSNSGKRRRDHGAWGWEIPDYVQKEWRKLEPGFKSICEKHKVIEKTNNIEHLGTLGTGNHFIEMCLDTEDNVWFMLHSGSRGVGNRIGSYFIELAKKDMELHQINLPDIDLAYLSEGTYYFNDYIEAVEWAQRYALVNRQVMMSRVVRTVQRELKRQFKADIVAVNCHHNYVNREVHYNEKVLVTRKGAVSARKDELGIIPGSMGAKSFIVRGLGNPESFHSCSHGAGRVMSRTKAKKVLTLDDHITATDGVECRKDKNVIDESPAAYKDIDAVMNAQKDLVEIVYTLKQVVCVKG